MFGAQRLALRGVDALHVIVLSQNAGYIWDRHESVRVREHARIRMSVHIFHAHVHSYMLVYNKYYLLLLKVSLSALNTVVQFCSITSDRFRSFAPKGNHSIR